MDDVKEYLTIFLKLYIYNIQLNSIYETRENIIPTIHIKGLIRIVKKIPYVYDFDRTKDQTLKKYYQYYFN